MITAPADMSPPDISPPDIRLPQDPSWQSEHISYTVAAIRVPAQYGSHVWSKLLIPINGGNYRGEPKVVLPERVDDWPLYRLQEHLVKAGTGWSSMHGNAAGVGE
jgi:hypothetical protein